MVVPLLNEGRMVNVISHSWGTVVAYNAASAGPARVQRVVHNFFTVGSALSIGPVRARLQPPDMARPSHVRSWLNLDAEGDIVGGELRVHGFPTTWEFLDLPQSAATRSWVACRPPAPTALTSWQRM